MRCAAPRCVARDRTTEGGGELRNGADRAGGDRDPRGGPHGAGPPVNVAKISAFVAARDEEDRIVRCLRSLSWADERIVILDAATTDATAERARPLATDLVVRPWDGFAGVKRIALSRCRNDWVLWLDADEAVDPELATAIRAAVADPRGHAGFRMRRRNHYLGRIVRHGAWSNDRVLRLFRKDAARIVDRLVHEGVAVAGPVGDLDGALDHWSYRDLLHHQRKIATWSRLWAAEAKRAGRRAGPHDLLFRPPLRFLKGYVLKAGFLDGRAGLVLAFLDAVYVGMKYASLIEANLDRGDGEDPERGGTEEGGTTDE
ncbi:MAG: glycosyltransferase [Candidatus Latescibacteria bacterium]|nr:glycosyltransferase [Candidatus Latescibacterota bacterium]